MNKADHATTTIPAPGARPAASRRTLLMGLAAAVAVPAPALTSALGGADPIFAVIEAHHEAMAHESACGVAVDRLDGALPEDQTTWYFYESEDEWTPPEGCADAPEWVEAQQNMGEAYDLRFDAVEALLTTEPTTMAGAIALLEYVGSPEYPWERGASTPILFNVVDLNDQEIKDAALAFLARLGATMRRLIAAA